MVASVIRVLIERWRLRRALGRVEGRLVAKNVLAYLRRSDALAWSALCELRAANPDDLHTAERIERAKASLVHMLSDHDAIREMLRDQRA